MKVNFVPTYPRRSFNEALRSLGFELKVGDDSGGHETWANRKGQRVKPQATGRKRDISHAHAVITAKALLHMGAVRTTSEFMNLVKRGKDGLGRTVRDRVRASEVAARPEVADVPVVVAPPVMSKSVIKRVEAQEKGKRMARRIDSVSDAVMDKVHKNGDAAGGHWIWMGPLSAKNGQPSFRATMHDGKVVVENPRKILMGGFDGKRAYIQPKCGEMRCVRPDHMIRGKSAPIVIREMPMATQALPTVFTQPVAVPAPQVVVKSGNATLAVATILDEFMKRKETLEAALEALTLEAIAKVAGVDPAYVSTTLNRYGFGMRKTKNQLLGGVRNGRYEEELVDPRAAEMAALRRDEEALAQMEAELKAKRERLSQQRGI